VSTSKYLDGEALARLRRGYEDALPAVPAVRQTTDNKGVMAAGAPSPAALASLNMSDADAAQVAPRHPSWLCSGLLSLTSGGAIYPPTRHAPAGLALGLTLLVAVRRGPPDLAQQGR
jgi:hypothetical protein